MSRPVKLTLVVLAVVLGAVVIFVLDLLADAGAFRTVEPHFDGSCRPIKGVLGAEDIVHDDEGERVFLSSSDWRAMKAGRPAAGGIYVWPLDGSRPPQKVETDLDGPFHPHGLDLLRADDGVLRLFVVNHPDITKSTVEVFAVDQGPRLRHLRTVKGAEVFSLNDVAAVGPEQFYATKDAGTRFDSPWRTIETFLRMPWAGVVYYDGQRLTTVIDGLVYANGIALSADGNMIYVAETTGRAIHVYRRDPDSGRLAWRATQALSSGFDNISLDRRGRLWIAAHPKLLAFLEHAEDPEARSPSQVFVLRPPQDAARREPPEEIWLDDGSTLSGSSVALPISQQRFLVGSVFEPHFLDCRRGR